MQQLHYIDLIIVLVYLALCLVIGLNKLYSVKSFKQFASGTQRATTPILVCTIFATAIGAGSTIGYAEKYFTLGTIFFITQLLQPAYWLISSRIFAHNIEQFRSCITISQVMKSFYGSYGHWITNISSLIIGVGIVAAHAIAIGNVFNYFFNLQMGYGILISYGIMTLYSACGGVRAVVLTEVFQFAVFFFIIPVSCAIALTKIGGLETLMHKLPISEWGMPLTMENLPFTLSLIVYSLLPEFHSPHMQRYLMATDAATLKRSLKIITIISIPFTISLACIAFIVRVTSPDINPEETLFYFIANDLPFGIKGLMVGGILAVIMSTAESWINSSSIIIVNDIIKVFKPQITEYYQLCAARICVVVITAISVLIALVASDILEVIIIVDNLWTPIILIPISAGFLGFKTHQKSFIFSVIVALSITLITRIIVGEFNIITLCMGLLGSASGLFGTHYCIIATAKIKNVYGRPESIKKKSIIDSLNLFIKKTSTQIKDYFSFKNLKADFYPFASFTMIYYFIYTMHLTSSPSHKPLLIMLIFGYFICSLLLLKDILITIELQKRFLPYYWFFSLTFCLPFVSSYTLFASKGEGFWALNALLSAFSLYFFTSSISFLIILLLGIVGGYVSFIMFNSDSHASHSAHDHTLLIIGYVYIFFLFTVLYIARKKEKHHEEQLEMLLMIGGAIAHEVKSPMATMSMCAHALDDILKKSLKTVIRKNNHYKLNINENEYILLNSVNESIQKLGHKGIATVDSILTSLKTSVIATDKNHHSVAECVGLAINEYSLYNKAVSSVVVNISPKFIIYCSKYYLKHVFFNLFKNSYKYNSNNVDIKIWSSGNVLYFRDYGVGIDETDLPHIFQRFYTKSESGTGIGLAFAKMVMEDLGGSIECISKPNIHTTFLLTFPIVKDNI